MTATTGRFRATYARVRATQWVQNYRMQPALNKWVSFNFTKTKTPFGVRYVLENKLFKLP